MKRWITCLFALCLCVTLTMPAFADATLPRLVDDADLLSNREEAAVLADLDEISERQQVDVVVVTVDSLDGKSPMMFADDFYDDNGYGFGASYDGVLLLVSMEDSDWYVSTCGYAITAITDAGLDYMSDQFVPFLSDGDFAEAFSTYARLCDEFITQAKTGEPFDVGNLPKEPFSVFGTLLLALVIGLVVALIVTGVMKGQLKTVRPQPAAANYMKGGSLQITESRDLFLYRNVTRTAKPKNTGSGGSGTHVSSAGRVHGGGGGKF